MTIERAVGVVMASLDLDPVRAFDALRRSARGRGELEVADVAAEIVAARRFSSRRPRHRQGRRRERSG